MATNTGIHHLQKALDCAARMESFLRYSATELRTRSVYHPDVTYCARFYQMNANSMCLWLKPQ